LEDKNMKNFRICNNDLNNWKEYSTRDAIDVVRFLESNKKDYKNYEIAWKTPVTGAYHTLIEKEGNKTTIDTVFEIPAVFKKLI
jgi:hypothetical protein